MRTGRGDIYGQSILKNTNQNQIKQYNEKLRKPGRRPFLKEKSNIKAGFTKFN